LRGSGGDGLKDRVILDIGFADPKEQLTSALPPLPAPRVE
jgi:hypothetical protein